jgi:hypothetical protein
MRAWKSSEIFNTGRDLTVNGAGPTSLPTTPLHARTHVRARAVIGGEHFVPHIHDGIPQRFVPHTYDGVPLTHLRHAGMDTSHLREFRIELRLERLVQHVDRCGKTSWDGARVNE